MEFSLRMDFTSVSDSKFLKKLHTYFSEVPPSDHTLSNDIGMIQDDLSEAEVYEFKNGDDRSAFLHSEPSHVLCLWHVAYKCEIFHTARQQLTQGVLADDGESPKAVGSAKKQKLESKADVGQFLSNVAETLGSNAKMMKLQQQISVKCDRLKWNETTERELGANIVDYEMKLADAEEAGNTMEASKGLINSQGNLWNHLC